MGDPGMHTATRHGLRTTAWAIALSVALTTIGCAYSTARPYPGTVQTVCVEMFGSKEFRRGLEFQLTEAVQKRILTDTTYRLADKAQADTLLTGEVVEVRQAALGSDPRTGRPRETAATFVVSVQWKDLRSGKVLLDRPAMVQTVDYIQPVGETFFQASNEAIDDLAERIVEEMQTDW
jgi:hypothetical protein